MFLAAVIAFIFAHFQVCFVLDADVHVELCFLDSGELVEAQIEQVEVELKLLPARNWIREDIVAVIAEQLLCSSYQFLIRLYVRVSTKSLVENALLRDILGMWPTYIGLTAL